VLSLGHLDVFLRAAELGAEIALAGVVDEDRDRLQLRVPSG
jgi:hypothetical protein